MQSISRRSRSSDLTLRAALALVCAALLVPGNAPLMAQEKPATPAAAPEAAAKLPAEQLDSLVAPIALYPDPLLAQTLAASTYPLEIIQLQQWMAKNPNLKDKALADAVAKQPWDPAVQSMAAFPDVVKRLGDDVQWTTDLGNAFLAQQSDVMDAVQRMRKKAKDNDALKSNEQQKVETQVIEKKEVIVIESANPEVIYVPSYSPTVVYGPPVYPYPPIYYPPYPPGAAFVSFTAGVMIGAAIWGGAWGHCGWGSSSVNINVNNNYNRNNINTGGNRGGGNNWQHNSQHRGGAPYGDKATANKYGGSARGGPSASQQGARTAGSASASQQGRGGASAGSRGASPSTSNRSAGASAGSRSASPSAKGGGFGGGSGGFKGSSARASSSRGASSMGGRSGGRGGGGRRR